MRKTGLAAASFALAVTISSLLFAQPAPMPPPAPIMPPSLPPSHVVNLMTNEGSAVFGAQWRVGDVKIVEVPAAINKERYKTAYQFEPRAMATDFDDSKWETVEGKDLGARRSAGHVAFLWYRALLTMPAQVGSFDLSKPTQAVFNVLVDDYGEVWVNGQMPRRSGYPSPATIQGLNMPNRVVLGTQVKAGDKFQIAVFAITGRSRMRLEASGSAKRWWSFINECHQVVGLLRTWKLAGARLFDACTTGELAAQQLAAR